MVAAIAQDHAARVLSGIWARSIPWRPVFCHFCWESLRDSRNISLLQRKAIPEPFVLASRRRPTMPRASPADHTRAGLDSRQGARCGFSISRRDGADAAAIFCEEDRRHAGLQTGAGRQTCRAEACKDPDRYLRNCRSRGRDRRSSRCGSAPAGMSALSRMSWARTWDAARIWRVCGARGREHSRFAEAHTLEELEAACRGISKCLEGTCVHPRACCREMPSVTGDETALGRLRNGARQTFQSFRRRPW